jgi:Leucine-rich repeat (LRR) protein
MRPYNSSRQTTLDVSGRRLTALPPEIGRLTALQSLDLRGNLLTAPSA